MLTTKQDKPKLLTVKEVAKYLSVTERTVYRIIKGDPRFPAFKVGGQWRFNLELVDAWGRNSHHVDSCAREDSIIG